MQTLNGRWKLAPDAANEGKAGRWFEAVRTDAKDAAVPGIVQQVFPTFHGVAWYWCSFAPARLPTGDERAIVRFGAVDYLAEVWLNGQAVGRHENGETPFELDVTGAVRAKKNLLAVRVVKPGNKERIDGLILAEIPHRNQYDHDVYQPGMGLNTGGIVLPVEFFCAPAVRIVDIFAQPDAVTGRIAVQTTVRNDTGRAQAGRLTVALAAACEGHRLHETAGPIEIPLGESTRTLTLHVASPRLWSLDDPYLYRVTATMQAGHDSSAGHEYSVRCGFRDFRVIDGFFHLNGKRLFLRSSHTGNHFPIGHVVPPDPALMRRDLLMAKTAGFNCIRFIAGMPYPEQLDCCDDIGLMVYEENLATWALDDSPHMAPRYDRACREMIRRDRNHPSVTIWGMINEMPDGPVFRRAVADLKLVRELDPTRLVLLASGRWDAHPTIGSASNPGSNAWEPVWGIEGPQAPKVDSKLDWNPGGYIDRAGDAHFYPPLPKKPEFARMLRTLGTGTKPVFLSECGVGSQFNAVDELRGYGSFGGGGNLVEVTMIRQWVEHFTGDLKKWKMAEVYPFPADFFRDSYRHQTNQRRLLFDLVRSNPQLCGYNITGLLDHALTGEGLWTFWRRWKPGIADVLEDGWSPLRWCLFVDPMHGYVGRPVRIEAVLATEDVMPPGDYPVCFRIWGSQGVLWQKRVKVRIPAPAQWGGKAALAIPVLNTTIRLDAPPGEYVLAADLERGGAPTGDRLAFRLAAPERGRKSRGTLAVWGIDERVRKWLQAQGYSCRPLSPSSRPRGPVLIGDVQPDANWAPTWEMLRSWMMQGTTVLLASAKPLLVKPGQLPLGDVIKARTFHDWLYHKDIVGKRHPVFAGLPAGGILDWSWYGQVGGHNLFDCAKAPDDVAAAAFAVGYSCPGGYASGIVVGSTKVGKGRLVFSALDVLEHVDRHPAADRLLLNLIGYAHVRR